MASHEMVMVIEKPYLTVKLHERVLEVDFADGLRKEVEDALEANSAIRETLGFLFQSVVPLDVQLKDIESASLDSNGHTKIAIPFRKDLIIPLGSSDSKRLVEKLNQLVPVEKARAAKDILENEKRRRQVEPQRARGQETYRRTLARTRAPS